MTIIGSANGNGNKKAQLWAAGILTTLCLTGSGALVHAVAEHAERIATLEARHQSIDSRLERIERRLDRLLDLTRKP